MQSGQRIPCAASLTFGVVATARFTIDGYDCSGSVSFALHGAGLLSAPLPSSDLDALRRTRARPMDYDLLATGPYLCDHCRLALRYDRLGPWRGCRSALVCGWAQHARFRRAPPGRLLGGFNRGLPRAAPPQPKNLIARAKQVERDPRARWQTKSRSDQI